MTNHEARDLFRALISYLRTLNIPGGVTAHATYTGVVFRMVGRSDVTKREMLAAKKAASEWLLANYPTTKFVHARLRGFRVWSWCSEYSNLHSGLGCGIEIAKSEIPDAYKGL